MNYGEFKEGINILIASFPTKNMSEEKTRLLFETYFAGLNFDPDVWVKACKTLGETTDRFPVLVAMKAAYKEIAKEKKPVVISHSGCMYCNGIGLRSYYKKKNGTRYTHSAICDCEAGAKYGGKWATWSEKEKQGKFVQHEKEIIPEFIPFTTKYKDPEELGEVPF